MKHIPNLQFHQNEDRSRQCALSIVMRYAFTISDHVCQDLDIVLKPGSHVPADSDLSVKTESGVDHKSEQTYESPKSWPSSRRNETDGRRSPYERAVTPKTEYRASTSNEWTTVNRKQPKRER